MKRCKAAAEVIYDARDVRAGVMFSDADLLGVPVRIVVSPRSLAEGQAELSTRDKRLNKKVPIGDIVEEAFALIQTLSQEIKEKVK